MVLFHIYTTSKSQTNIYKPGRARVGAGAILTRTHQLYFYIFLYIIFILTQRAEQTHLGGHARGQEHGAGRDDLEDLGPVLRQHLEIDLFGVVVFGVWVCRWGKKIGGWGLGVCVSY